jgi:hypothetical protein
MDFAPDETPRPIFKGVFSVRRASPIVLPNPAIQIVCLADVESPSLVLEDVHPEWSEYQAPRDDAQRNLPNDCSRFHNSRLPLVPRNRRG